MDILMYRRGKDTMDVVFENRNCPMTLNKIDAVTQSLYIRLRTLMGDWYLNVGYGVPWLEKVLGHKIRKSTVDMVIQEQILLDNDVLSIPEFTSTLDRARRAYECRFRVETVFGGSGIITISSL